jgi:hypothetical protein
MQNFNNMSNTTRVKGKYASKLQRALFEANIWKAQTKMLMSMLDGQANTIRRLTEENLRLKCNQTK